MVRSAAYRGQIIGDIRALSLALLLGMAMLSPVKAQTLPETAAPAVSETPPAQPLPPAVDTRPNPTAVARPPRRERLRNVPAISRARQGVASPVAATVVPRPALDATRLEAYVDGVVRNALKQEKIAGASIAVVQNGQTVLLKGYGYARLNPATTVDPNTTLFRIGSISKTFTWVAAMQEVESGRLSLDKPIKGFLPDDIDFDNSSSERKLTLRDIMGQASGYEDSALGHLFALNPNKILSSSDYLSRHKPRRVRDPGQFATYSNYATGLAAAATVKSAKARDYPTLAEARILSPLGMSNTTFREPYAAREDLPTPISARLAGQLSEGFSWDGATLRPRMTEHLIHGAGVGAGSSTAADMATYMQVLLRDGQIDANRRLFGEATAKAFRTPVLKTPAGVNGWAHGFAIETLPGGYKAYGHGGATLWFHSNMVLVPSLNLGIFITTNTNTGSDLAHRFPAALVADFYAPDSQRLRSGDPRLAEQSAQYEGQFISTRRAYGGLEGFVMRFIGTASARISPDGYLILSGEGGASAWVPSRDPNVFLAARGPETLSIIRDDKGRLMGWTPSYNLSRFERVDGFRNPELLSTLVGLALFAAVVTWVGAFSRIGRIIRPTQNQIRADIVQLITATLWIGSVCLFVLWGAGTQGDPAMVFEHWPNGLVRSASFMALLSTLLTLFLLATLPWTFTLAHHRMDGWSPWRKLWHLCSVLIWLATGLLLGLWGALEPWSW